MLRPSPSCSIGQGFKGPKGPNFQRWCWQLLWGWALSVKMRGGGGRAAGGLAGQVSKYQGGVGSLTALTICTIAQGVCGTIVSKKTSWRLACPWATGSSFRYPDTVFTLYTRNRTQNIMQGLHHLRMIDNNKSRPTKRGGDRPFFCHPLLKKMFFWPRLFREHGTVQNSSFWHLFLYVFFFPSSWQECVTRRLWRS